jgi:hypothetical protein
MDLRHLLVFTHVAAVVGLFSALALEGVALRFLGRARSYEQAREWTGVWRILPALGAPSLLLVLASGIYLATAFGLWEFGWTRMAVPTIVLVAILGGVLGPHRNRVRAAVSAHGGALPSDLLAGLRRPLERASWRLRAALLTGLLFEMTMKSEAGLLTMAPFALVGLVGAAAAWNRRT